MAADRFNVGKPRMGLLPAWPMLQMAEVLTFGAQKYDAHNWRKGLPYLGLVDSLSRHVAAFTMGEDFDPESGIHHMAHAMCNAAFAIQYQKDGLVGFDDRYIVDQIEPPIPGTIIRIE